MTVKADWVDKDTPGYSAADWTYDAVAANAVAAQVNTNTSAISGKQAADSDLTAIAGLSPNNDDVLQRKSGAWTNRTLAQLITDLNITGYTTIAALRSATASVNGAVQVLGYYGAGDGGGGVFRWDSTDTTSADNGGTIITPNDSGLAATGRWRRVCEGECNARWFGMNPSQTDNTAQLQAAVDWVSTEWATRNPNSGGMIGGVVFIPMGYYRIKLDSGTSGLSTITIAANYVTIRGEGAGTWLTMRHPTTDADYLFTFTQNGRGQGGGVKDLVIDGGSKLKWGIYLDTWRDATFENISATDLHGGILDAESTDTVNLGENITVRQLDHAASSGTNSCTTQYGVRFRAGTGATTTTWSECWIYDALFVNCWDSGVVLDGVQRFRVRNVGAANNTSSTDTIDGAAKAGALHAVRITNTIDKTATANSGDNLVQGAYLESHYGTETVTTNVAVLVETPTGQTKQNRWNKISSISAHPEDNCSYVRFVDANNAGLTNNNIFLDPDPVAITSSATPAINTDQTRQFTITAQTEAITSFTTNLTGVPMSGQHLTISITGTASRDITWGTAFEASTVALPTATVSTARLDVEFVWNAATSKWRCVRAV